MTTRTPTPISFALALALAALATLLAGAPDARAATPGAPQPMQSAQRRPRVEVAFVLDTTGSMSGLLEGAKQKIWSIASHIANGQPRPDVRMALVAYRDRGDAYITTRTELTDDIDHVYARLRELSADGGGDGPESVNQALHEAVTRLGWSTEPGVYRVIFLVGDAPPHMDYANDAPYPGTLRTAQRKGIVVNTVQCGAMQETTPVWQAIARAGEGRYVAIAQDGGMVVTATPFDEELARVNRSLTATVVPWGRAEEQAELVAKAAGALAAPAPTAAERLAFLEKSGGRVNLGRRDLVDAVKDGTVDAKTVPATELPAELKPLSPEAREAWVKEKIEQREALHGEVRTLSAKRDAWLQDDARRRKAAGGGDGFDEAVLEAIRAQAARHGLAF